MAKITFATKSCWPGVENSLKFMASVLKSEFPGHDVSYVEVSQNGFPSGLIHMLKSNPMDILILGGWDRTIRDIVTNVNRHVTKVYLEWCSPLSQTEMGGEIPLFIEVINFIRLGMLKGMMVLIESDYTVLKNFNEGIHYCPVCIDFNNLELEKVDIHKDTSLGFKCDMFCAPNPRKNLFSQIFALRGFNNLKVSVNYKTSEYVESVKRYLPDHEFCDWMSRSQYLRKIQEMNFACQVTFSESFNMTVAEHMYYGVPVVCSSFLSYVNPSIQELAVRDPNNCYEIYSKVKNLIDNPYKIIDLGENCKKSIIDINKRNRDSVVEFLGGIING